MTKPTLIVTVILGLLVFASAGAAQPTCEDGSEPLLVINTSQGTIAARLMVDAAPLAVDRLIRLASGPLFHPDLQAATSVGYFDGLAFSHTNPHVEIISDPRPPADAIQIPCEIDAHALGLDAQLVAGVGEAMDIAQMELAPAYKRGLKSGQNTEQLSAWMDTLYSTHDAAFLVGVSRKTLNEALGYRYQEGLASRPVDRGALMLKPVSPHSASPQLSIALTAMPQRNGRWMVVGQVVEGLDIADQISAMPLADPGVSRSRHRPVDPVPIHIVRLECRPCQE